MLFVQTIVDNRLLHIDDLRNDKRGVYLEAISCIA